MITSELLIAAPVETVWALTLDVEGWPATTPTMTSVERLDDGPLRVGSTARITQPKQRPAVWTVVELVPPTTFVWRTKVSWLTMTAGHHIEPAASGCRNTLTVDITGVGAGLVRRLVVGKVQWAIDTENTGFKATAEAQVGRAAS
jgi:uncharacterized membrane protein